VPSFGTISWMPSTPLSCVSIFSDERTEVASVPSFTSDDSTSNTVTPHGKNKIINNKKNLLSQQQKGTTMHLKIVTSLQLV
jgi:hypothetical protein